MLTTQGERVVGESREAWGTRLWVSLLGADSAGGVFVRSFCDSSGSCLPDLTDPATVGCLLALVRDAWGDPTYLPTCLDAHDEAWVIESPKRERQTRYGSYASVLVAALESAP